MKTVGPGGFGWARSGMLASVGRRLPLRRLHGRTAATMLSQTESPPRLRGITVDGQPARLAPAVLAGVRRGEDGLAGDLAPVDVARTRT